MSDEPNAATSVMLMVSDACDALAWYRQALGVTAADARDL